MLNYNCSLAIIVPWKGARMFHGHIFRSLEGWWENFHLTRNNYWVFGFLSGLNIRISLALHLYFFSCIYFWLCFCTLDVRTVLDIFLFLGTWRRVWPGGLRLSMWQLTQNGDKRDTCIVDGGTAACRSTMCRRYKNTKTKKSTTNTEFLITKTLALWMGCTWMCCSTMCLDVYTNT